MLRSVKLREGWKLTISKVRSLLRLKTSDGLARAIAFGMIHSASAGRGSAGPSLAKHPSHDCSRFKRTRSERA